MKVSQLPRSIQVPLFLLAGFFLFVGGIKFFAAPTEGSFEFGGSGENPLTNPLLLSLVGLVEIGVAIGLVSKFWRSSIIVGTSLVGTFWGFLFLRSINHQSSEGCGCFGALELSPTTHFGIVIVAFFLGIWVLWTAPASD